MDGYIFSVKLPTFIPLAAAVLLFAGCQTTSQKTNYDPYIKESLDRAAIPADRCAIVTVASKSTGKITAQPVYHGVMTLSGRVQSLLNEQWIGRPVTEFDRKVMSILKGPVQEYGYPAADRTVFIYSN